MDTPPKNNMTNPGLQSVDPLRDSSTSLAPSVASLSHTDSDGHARMVDVGQKPDQLRVAKARGSISLQPGTIHLIRENLMKKGDVLTVAEIAGIQAAKATQSLIPLCHNINLTSVKVVTDLTESGVSISSEVQCVGQTGVEMEALTAVSVGLLTIYDMCKAVDKQMTIDAIHLTEKTKNDIPR